MTETDIIKQAYRSRIRNLENSIGVVLLWTWFLKRIHTNMQAIIIIIWKTAMYGIQRNIRKRTGRWPILFSFRPIKINRICRFYDHSAAICVLTKWKQWADTFNTAGDEHDRGESYEAFKQRQNNLTIAKRNFRGLEVISRPIMLPPFLSSYRDYIGSDDGSMYGIVEKITEPVETLISPEPKSQFIPHRQNPICMVFWVANDERTC